MRRAKQRRNHIVLLLILLLTSISLGYAFLSQELTINGTGKVTASSWNIYFDNLVPNQNNVTLSTGDVAAAIDTSTNTDVTYTVTLQQPGDFYEFTVDVVNDGSIDAMVGTISNKLNGTEISTQNPLPAYLRYTATYSDGVAIAPNHLLEGNGGTETYKVRLEYRTDIDASVLPGTNQTFTLNFGVEYVQADSNAKDKPVFVLPEGRTANTLQVGDELCISGATTECFNFIRYDENDDAVLLAKYNLKVGRNYDNSNSTYSNPYTSSDPGYGLQDSSMVWDETSETWRGVVAFSYTNYWYDGNTLKEKYGSSYPVNVYDIDYVTEPDFTTACDNSTNCFKTSGYSIAYYVNQYKNKLIGTGYGTTIKDARLLTYSEATDSSIGCNASMFSCPSSGFITNTNFFLGSAYSNVGVWDVGASGSLGSSTSNYDRTVGVRPVIVVEKSNL